MNAEEEFQIEREIEVRAAAQEFWEEAAKAGARSDD